MKVAVIGGGWAGLAAAVAATQRGHQVTLIEMAQQLGGRARTVVTPDGGRFDNGQHILIGAYTQSLALLQTVGVDLDAALLRMPLRLRYPRHESLRLPPGPPLISFARGVLTHPSWPLMAKMRFLAKAGAWLAQGFRCAPALTVEALCADLPAVVNAELIAPLCVAALNTPARRASAAVFLRVLRDALFSGPGSADLLLPRVGLSALLAEPVARWLAAQGAEIQLGKRVENLADLAFDSVILACPSGEAARLARPLNPAWADLAEGLRFEPIITVFLYCPGATLPAPMVALLDGADAPAQFAFDLGQLGHSPGLFSFVVSGAAHWVQHGMTETGLAVLAQAQRELPWPTAPKVLRVLAEKRATFACTPGLARPPAQISPGLWAAGDFVDGPYPATLEGAVRAGQAAAAAIN